MRDYRIPCSVTSSRYRWWAVFAAAVGVRLLYWTLVTPDWVPVADADQYVLLARSLADGDGFSLAFPQMEIHPTAFRPPLLPVLLAPTAWMFGDALWPVRLVSVVVSSVGVVLAGQYAARIGGRRAGWIAAACVAVYPPLLANDTIGLTEPLALVLLLWALLALDEDQWLRCGVAAGLLMLARPNGYGVVAILAAFLWHRLGWRRALAFGAVVALCVGPWIVRNQVQVGTTRLVTSDGFTLAAMYSPQAQERGRFVDPVFDSAFDDPTFRWAQFDEAGWNDVLTEAAMEGIRQNPGYVLTVLRSNVSAYFEIDPSRNRWAEDNDGRNWAFRSRTLPAFYLVTTLGIAGVAVWVRDRRLWPFGLIVLQYLTLSLLLVAPPRLRAPFDLLCCIGVGLLTASIHDRRQRQRVAPPADRRPSVGVPS